MAGESVSRAEVQVGRLRSSVLVAGPEGGDAAVVFVHGNPGSGRDWTTLLERVGEFARCVAPDMPGYGETDKPRDFDYTVEGYGRHLDMLLGRLGVRRVHLVTHDLGGPWGLSWAARRPADLASLTLMSIGVLPGYRWHRFARLYRVPLLGELVLARAGRSAMSRAMQRGSQRGMPGWFVDEAVRQYRDPSTRHAVLAFYRATPDLGAITVTAARAIGPANPPTMVIWGAGDPYVPVRFAEAQRRFFPRAEVVVLPRSGHWPLIDDPEAVVDAVVPFLRTQVTGEGSTSGGSRP
jgi:pimeloyl-ACP methyl ester carboxylesterase